MKNYIYIRMVLILIPIIVLGILVYKDINPRGESRTGYDFCREDAFISKLSPDGRVLKIEKSEGKCWQEMVIDPVYFDVRLPQKFATARIKLWYKKEASQVLKIGPMMDSVNWQWQLKDINYMKNDGEWMLGLADYHLADVEMNRNRLRFMISAPGLDESGASIIFDKIEIEFDRDSWDGENWRERIKEWLSFSNIWFLIEAI